MLNTLSLRLRVTNNSSVKKFTTKDADFSFFCHFKFRCIILVLSLEYDVKYMERDNRPDFILRYFIEKTKKYYKLHFGIPL